MPKDMSLLEKDGAPTEEELKEFFRKHDFSSQVSSFDVNTASESENRLYIRATKIFRGSWNDQVYTLGGKKTLRNFSKNDPLRCLEDSEEKLVSGTVAEIASDEDLFQSIIDSVFSSSQNELYASALKLAEQNGKTIDDLTDEEIALVIDSFSDELLASIMGKLLLTQSVPEILGVLKTDRAHEDYNPSVRENHDQIDFIRHWDHTRSKVGQMFCFDEMVQVDLKNDDGKVKTPVYVEDEDEEKLYQEFRALLTEEEKLIADMRWNKQMTQKEIAEALGYKSHSAVTKKLKKMREKFDTMRK